VSLGKLETEADLERFIQDRLQPLQTKVTQVQGFDLSQMGVARGTGTVTITDGTQAVSAAVAHGLSGEPAAIVCTARRAPDTRNDFVVNIASRTSLVFQVSIRGAEANAFPVANPTVVTFDWVAVL
jgi:hypothetical protein